MRRRTFSLNDFSHSCDIEEGCYQLEGKALGLRIHIPKRLQESWPFNASAYDFLQFFRQEIQTFGIIELPDLPVNKSNYTLAQGSPEQHRYSSNPFLTDYCQQPHQDTPPYPTAFWLNEKRQFFATWLMSAQGAEYFLQYQQQNPAMHIKQIHKKLQTLSIEQGWGILVNHEPGLILIDNSQHRSLYHTRTCNFKALESHTDHHQDSRMYAFNEIGLLNYINQLDSRRGSNDRCEKEQQQVAAFMQAENVTLNQ